jgi:hypothetical protein
LLIAVSLASAQTKRTFSGKCGKPENPQSIPVGDKDGHMFIVEQGKCETDKGEIGGAKSKDGACSEHGEVMGNHIKVSGVYVET